MFSNQIFNSKIVKKVYLWLFTLSMKHTVDNVISEIETELKNHRIDKYSLEYEVLPDKKAEDKLGKEELAFLLKYTEDTEADARFLMVLVLWNFGIEFESIIIRKMNGTNFCVYPK